MSKSNGKNNNNENNISPSRLNKQDVDPGPTPPADNDVDSFDGINDVKSQAKVTSKGSDYLSLKEQYESLRLACSKCHRLLQEQKKTVRNQQIVIKVYQT